MAEELNFYWYPQEKDENGNYIPPIKNTYLLHDLGVGNTAAGQFALLQKRLLKHREKTLIKLLSELIAFCNEHNIPRPICEDAAKLIHTLKDKMHLGNVLCAALTKIALRYPNAIVWDAVEKRCDMRKMLSVLSRFENVHSDPKRLAFSFIETACNRLGFSADVAALAERIALNWWSWMIGIKPRSIAAATVYVAAVVTGNDITQDRAAETLGVTANTIRNILRKVRPRIIYIDEDNGIEYAGEYTGKYVGLPTPYYTCIKHGMDLLEPPSPRNVIVKGREIIARGVKCGFRGLAKK